MKEMAIGFLAVFFLATAQADDSIQLPSGTVVKIASFATHPNWKECFPPDHAFFAEKNDEGNLKGMHSRYSARLDGVSATLHENGNLKILAFYPGGKCQGMFRLWDEEKHMLLYSHYKDNQKHGITCLLNDGTPWLVQEWEKGALQSETVLVRKGSEFVPVDDAEQLAKAQKRLSTIEKELAERERDLKKSLGEWFLDEKSRIKKERDKILTPVAQAQHKVREQGIKKERADESSAAADAVARSHSAAAYYESHHRVTARIAVADSRVAGAASAVSDAARKASQSADRDIQDASENAQAVIGDAKHELAQMDKEITEHYEQLYHFALAALEKSLPNQ